MAGDGSRKASEMSSHYQYLQTRSCREAVNKTSGYAKVFHLLSDMIRTSEAQTFEKL